VPRHFVRAMNEPAVRPIRSLGWWAACILLAVSAMSIGHFCFTHESPQPASAEFSVFGCPLYAFWNYTCHGHPLHCPENSTYPHVPAVICVPHSPASPNHSAVHCFFLLPWSSIPSDARLHWSSGQASLETRVVNFKSALSPTLHCFAGWLLWIGSLASRLCASVSIRELWSSVGLALDTVSIRCAAVLGLEEVLTSIPARLLALAALLYFRDTFAWMVLILVSTAFIGAATVLHMLRLCIGTLDDLSKLLLVKMLSEGRFTARPPPDSAAHPDEPADDQNIACVICMVNQRTHTAVPCGHTQLCNECTRTKTLGLSCPVCRGVVREWIKVYDC
jgi:hypothetical protein